MSYLEGTGGAVNNWYAYSAATGTVQGTLAMTDTTISTNAAGQTGGGLFNTGTAQLTRVTLDHNTAPRGAAIYNEGELELNTSTLSDNTATYHGGAVYQAGGTLTVRYSTVADNTGEDNNAIYLDQGQRGNTKFMGVAVSGGVCAGDTPQSEGNNLENGNTCGFDQASDLPDNDPLLGPLAANGGLTRTRMPAVGSAVTDSAARPAPARISAARPDRSAPPATSARWRWWRCRWPAAQSWTQLPTRPSAAPSRTDHKAGGPPSAWPLRAVSSRGR